MSDLYQLALGIIGSDKDASQVLTEEQSSTLQELSEHERVEFVRDLGFLDAKQADPLIRAAILEDIALAKDHLDVTEWHAAQGDLDAASDLDDSRQRLADLIDKARNELGMPVEQAGVATPTPST